MLSHINSYKGMGEVLVFYSLYTIMHGHMKYTSEDNNKTQIHLIKIVNCKLTKL